MRRRWCLVSLLVPSIVSAQMLELEPGMRVKVKAPAAASGTLAGVVAAQSGDSITLLSSSPPTMRRLSRSSVTALSISGGRSAIRGLKKGLLWGTAIGLPFSVSTSFDSTFTVGADNKTQIGKGEYVASMTASFAVVGALIGAIVGAETWSDYQFPVRVAAGSTSARLGASYRF